jgi:hypothetical protein
MRVTLLVPTFVKILKITLSKNIGLYCSILQASYFFGSRVIRLQRIYNFWCSMLVFTLFAYRFITLRGTFMHFPELTYSQVATVPIPYFLLFLCFRSDTQEIFSELDETSSWSLIFPGSFQRSEEELEGGHEGPTHQGGAARGLAAPPMCESPSGHLWRCLFAYKDPPMEKT